jgi:amphi-Trp domain-containing protein
MDMLEITGKETVGRKEAAARLRALATALAPQQRRGLRARRPQVQGQRPDEVDFKVEIEVQDDEWELEVELTWGRKHRRGAKRS